MFSQIYGMSYYNVVLSYSSFHHGISKSFISINYGTPRGGTGKIDTHHGAAITQISSGSGLDNPPLRLGMLSMLVVVCGERGSPRRSSSVWRNYTVIRWCSLEAQ